MKTVNSRTPQQIVGGIAFRSHRNLTFLIIPAAISRRCQDDNGNNGKEINESVLRAPGKHEGVLVVADDVRCYGRVLSQK